MKKTGLILFIYIVIVYGLKTAVLLVPEDMSSLYLSAAIFAMGITAILFQKLLNKGKFLDMGFRLNRNAATGIVIGIAYIVIVFAIHYWLPARLGLIKIELNEKSEISGQGGISLFSLVLIVFLGGLPLFLGSLFGEELTFRGYILPKLNMLLNPFKSVIFCAVVFAIWHLPAYFSLYAGGAEEGGWKDIGTMLFAHGISVIPVCMLYLTTRELYGVSVLHALADVFQYIVVGNAAMGAASKDAVYIINIINGEMYSLLEWGAYLASILIMAILCKSAKRFLVS